jgi:hypothetical protein|uniref:Uncharacterized protein n=1 Tax=Ministeria vibrans TaxID=134558 RepID=M1JF75_MINVI|nr:hypothetical protein H890_mgp02 [Ministeria vibrans]AGE93718.1 hypothetical protein [Ministeria vibrans]
MKENLSKTIRNWLNKGIVIEKIERIKNEKWVIKVLIWSKKEEKLINDIIKISKWLKVESKKEIIWIIKTTENIREWRLLKWKWELGKKKEGIDSWKSRVIEDTIYWWNEIKTFKEEEKEGWDNKIRKRLWLKNWENNWNKEISKELRRDNKKERENHWTELTKELYIKDREKTLKKEGLRLEIKGKLSKDLKKVKERLIIGKLKRKAKKWEKEQSIIKITKIMNKKGVFGLKLWAR